MPGAQRRACVETGHPPRATTPGSPRTAGRCACTRPATNRRARSRGARAGTPDSSKLSLCSSIRRWYRRTESSNSTLSSIMPCAISSDPLRPSANSIGEERSYAIGSTCGVLRMFEVYSWLYCVQSVTGRSAAPALNTSGARNIAIRVMKPPYEPPYRPTRAGSAAAFFSSQCTPSIRSSSSGWPMSR